VIAKANPAVSLSGLANKNATVGVAVSTGNKRVTASPHKMHAKFSSLRETRCSYEIPHTRSYLYTPINFTDWNLSVKLAQSNAAVITRTSQTPQLPIQPSVSHCRISAGRNRAGRATVLLATMQSTRPADWDEDNDVTPGQWFRVCRWRWFETTDARFDDQTAAVHICTPSVPQHQMWS